MVDFAEEKRERREDEEIEAFTSSAVAAIG